MDNVGPAVATSVARPGGRLGLALSGGGFRAAFFHLGVLARMAELGVLHEVEVISTVSGGSVLGALYYLHARNLLQSKPDGDIGPEDYVALIGAIEGVFLAAVQRNLRMRTFANPWNNLRMSLSRRYSRSDRMGELYDRYFYRPVFGGEAPVELRDLKIQPPEGPEGFNPDQHNTNRTNKVPILLINATSLNTGHNWRFEAIRMGEPPRLTAAEREVDRTTRLCRPVSYEQMVPDQQDFPLGIAVAASTGVPGIFPPLAVSKLYPDSIRVQLVDGGVHDNQGIAALLERGCQRFVVSDAGGQLLFLPEPTTGLLGVLTRSNSVLMQRVREEQLLRLMERGARRAFMHLRRGLPTTMKPWIGADRRPVDVPECAPAEEETPTSEFGVAEGVQQRLARVRTDLDSFSDVEGCTLEYDGYRMSEGPVSALKEETARGPAPPVEWRFRVVEEAARRPDEGYLRQLEVARHRFGKVFRLNRAVGAASLVLTLAAFVAGVILLWRVTATLPSRRLPIGPILLGLGVFAGVMVARQAEQIRLPWLLVRKLAELVLGILKGLLLAAGSLLVWVHLLVFDRLFLWHGGVDRARSPGAR